MKKLFPSLLLGLAVGVAFPSTVHGQSLKDSFNQQQSAADKEKEFCEMVIKKAQFTGNSNKDALVYVHDDQSVHSVDRRFGNCRKMGYINKPFRDFSDYVKECKLRRDGTITRTFTLREHELSDSGITIYSQENSYNCQTGSVSPAPGATVFKNTYPFKPGFGLKKN